MNKSPLPPGGLVFRVPFLHDLRFRRYPIEVAPPGDGLYFVNNGRRQCAAFYVEGEWRDTKRRPLKWQPTHWTAMEALHGQPE